MMKKHLVLLLVVLPLKNTHAEMTYLDKKALNEGPDYVPGKTIESCYDEGISAVIQACLINLSIDKQEAYEAAFNAFIKDITIVKTHFFDFKLFSRLIKKTKQAWDKNVKDECLAEATLDEKDGFTYHYSYSQCLIKAYESRTKFYQDYREKIPALEYYADEVAGKK